jgi:DNA polymerase V
VFHIIDQAYWLDQMEVGDVWGIGRQWAKKLNGLNILTAYDLAKADVSSMKHTFNQNLLKTHQELNGHKCLKLEDWQPKKAIVSSCSFGEMQTSLSAIKEAVSYHCATAWAKMRKQKSCAQYVSVFIYSNRFRTDLAQYSDAAGFKLIHPCDDVRTLTQQSIKCLEHIYKEGFYYKKCGVLLTDFIDKNTQQLDMFSHISEASQANSARVMHVLEKINLKYGSRTMYLASEGIEKKWSMKLEIKTPCYTTRWGEIPIVYAR